MQTVFNWHTFMFMKQVNFKHKKTLSLWVLSADLYGAKHLASITMSSESNEDYAGHRGQNMAPLCLYKVALTGQNSLYCQSTFELAPWIKLEYQEEVQLPI